MLRAYFFTIIGSYVSVTVFLTALVFVSKAIRVSVLKSDQEI